MYVNIFILNKQKEVMNNKRKYFYYIGIGVFVYFFLLIVLVISEFQISDGSIKNFFDAIWYSIVTFSTVGYGDYFPISILGKIVGLIFILFAVGVLGLIIGKTTESFQRYSEKRRLGMMGTSFENHIIIVGWDNFSEQVAIQLINADKKVAIMTDNKNDIDIIYQKYSQKDIFVYFSERKNFSSLKLLNIEKARTILLNNGSDSDKLISILNIRRLFPTIGFVVILDDFDLKDTFVSAGVTYVLSKNEIASRLVASYIFEPAVAEYTKDLITSTNNELEYDIQQYRIINGNPFINKKYSIVFYELKEKYNIISIGLVKNSNGKCRLIKCPNKDEQIDIGDDLIVIANGATEKIMRDIFKVSEGIK